MTQTIHFRDGAAGDRDGVLALRRLAFPNEDPEKRTPDFWKWEFLDGYAGPGRFFVAEAGGDIVGHVGFVPQRYESGQTLLGALFVDAMTHPSFRRRKVFSGLTSFAVDKLRRDFQLSTIVQIRKAVLPGMLAAGWRQIRKVPILLRPLSFWWTARESQDDSVRSIQADDFDQIDALLATRATRQRRSAEFLRWRYLQNPGWRYEAHGFFEKKTLCAFAIHRQAVLRGIRTQAIADLGVLPGRDASLQHLLGQISRKGKTAGMSVAAAFLSREHPAYRPVRASGFFPGPHRFRFLVQIFDDSLRRDNDAGWSLSWGDTDHL